MCSPVCTNRLSAASACLLAGGWRGDGGEGVVGRAGSALAQVVRARRAQAAVSQTDSCACEFPPRLGVMVTAQPLNPALACMVKACACAWTSCSAAAAFDSFCFLALFLKNRPFRFYRRPAPLNVRLRVPDLSSFLTASRTFVLSPARLPFLHFSLCSTSVATSQL